MSKKLDRYLEERKGRRRDKFWVNAVECEGMDVEHGAWRQLVDDTLLDEVEKQEGCRVHVG
ncbi:hypothetical protein CVT26_013487 [Gymnopilus dilepis]|uniref:Uncharacterized protein n=1 Tax=Gymnopilus dilepis TaxID=231916 RepID=A0A409YWP8_9AGAR|nr:hypothetical protein CVT26_013487 [Gymnopilus dilepis]